MRFYIGIFFTFCALIAQPQLPFNSDIDTSYLNKVTSAYQGLINIQDTIIIAQDVAIKQLNGVISIQRKSLIFYQHTFLLFGCCALGLCALVAFFEFVKPRYIEQLFKWLSTIKNKILSFFIKT